MSDQISSSQSSGAADAAQQSEALSSDQYAELIKGLQSEVAQSKQTANAAAQEAKKGKEFAERIKSAVTGGEDVQMTAPEWERFLDPFLEVSLADQQKGGSGLPLTTKLAVQQAEMMKERAAMQKELKELRDMVKQQVDPAATADRQAYSTLDTAIESGLRQIYGDAFEGKFGQNIFNAVTASLSNELKEAQAKNPQYWQNMRINSAGLQNLARKHVSSIVPPKARALLEDQTLKDTPMSRGQLLQAFKEADVIKDDGERRAIKEAIRQQMLANMAPLKAK